MRMPLILVLAALGLVMAGVRENQLRDIARPDPHAITCADLIAHGPGDNAHVVLTDFAIGPRFAVEPGHAKDTWRCVWLAAQPPAVAQHDVDYLERTGFKGFVKSKVGVIVKSGAVRTEADLEPLVAAGRLQGVIVNRIQSLDSGERNILSQQYHVDFDHCWILEHGRLPPGPWSAVWLFVAAGGCVLGAVATMWRRRMVAV